MSRLECFIIATLCLSGVLTYPQTNLKSGIVGMWNVPPAVDNNYYFRQSRRIGYYPGGGYGGYPGGGVTMYPQPRPGYGCSGSTSCSSACGLQQQRPWYSGGWQFSRPSYYQPQPPLTIETSTSKPTYYQPPAFGGCSFGSCGGYGGGCGLRPSFNWNPMCSATGGWPSSYCGNQWSTAYCDGTLCSNDCRGYGWDGGYCDQQKCFCYRARPQETASPETAVESNTASDQPADSNP